MNYINRTNSRFFTIFVCLSSVLFFSACQQKKTKSEIAELERLKQDSIMKKIKTAAQDSILRIGDKVFADFFFGMTEKEYEKTKTAFVNETNGYVMVDNLNFYLFDPEYDNHKLSVFILHASDIIDEIQGQYISTDYVSVLKERFTNRLGYPDGYFDKDLQECDSISDNLRYIAWVFDTRTILLGFDKIFWSDRRLDKEYYIYFYTKEKWIEYKNYTDSLVESIKKKEKEFEERKKKYSNEI